MHDFDYEHYKRLDFSHARPARLNPKIKQLQDNLKVLQPQEQNELIAFFDSDVQQAIKAHNTPQDRVRLNAVLRALYMTA